MEDICELEPATDNDIQRIKDDIIETLTDFYPLTSIYRQERM